MKYELVSSALRIYLTNMLLQTEDAAEFCRMQMSQCSRLDESAKGNLWQRASNAAVAALKSLQDYQNKILSDVGAVSVVDSLQDSLREALCRARKGDIRDNNLHGKQSTTYDTAAVYLTQSLAAEKKYDGELSQWWLKAAQNLRQSVELKFNFEIRQVKVSSYMDKAADLEDNMEACAKSTKQGQLTERAIYHFRCAAALCALERPNSHSHAADLCIEAAQLHKNVDNLTDMTSMSGRVQRGLLERAAASWQLAAEMVALQASDNSHQYADPAVQSVVSAAEKAMKDSTSIATLLLTTNKLKEAVASTQDAIALCRNSTMLPMWRALAVKQEKALLEIEHCFENLLQGSVDAADAVETVTAIVDTAELAVKEASKLQAQKDRIAYYQQRAAQALQGARPSPLAHKCWTKAAGHLEVIVQLFLPLQDQYIASTEHDRTWCFHTRLADDCANIAENVLGCALECADKARAAKAEERAGRHRREARKWRKAAESLVQKAEILLSEVEAREIVMQSGLAPAEVAEESPEVNKITESIAMFIETAEYLDLAFKHCTLPDANQRQNGLRVAKLYECLAQLLTLKVKVANPSYLRKIMDQHLELIETLNGIQIVPEETIAARENVCRYGAVACAAPSPTLRDYWKKANDLLSRSLVTYSYLTNHRPRSGSAAAALYVHAASATSSVERRCFASAARALENSYLAYRRSGTLARYHNVLSRAILCHGAVYPTTPPEVTAFLDEVDQESYDRETLKSNTEEHAKFIMLRNRCKYERTLSSNAEPVRELWLKAVEEADALLGLLQQRADDVYGQASHLAAKITFRCLTVKCHVSLAEAPPDSARAAAWSQAVEVCRTAVPVQKIVATTLQSDRAYKKAIETVERAVKAAEMTEAQVAQNDLPPTESSTDKHFVDQEEVVLEERLPRNTEGRIRTRQQVKLGIN